MFRRHERTGIEIIIGSPVASIALADSASGIPRRAGVGDRLAIVDTGDPRPVGCGLAHRARPKRCALTEHLAFADDDCTKGLIPSLDREPPQLEGARHEPLALRRRRCCPRW